MQGNYRFKQGTVTKRVVRTLLVLQLDVLVETMLCCPSIREIKPHIASLGYYYFNGIDQIGEI